MICSLFIKLKDEKWFCVGNEFTSQQACDYAAGLKEISSFKIISDQHHRVLIGTRVGSEVFWRLQNGRNKPIACGTDYR